MIINSCNFGKIEFKKVFKFFGPAYLIGIGYMDPGNWATDLAGGSSFEFKLLWVLAISNILALFLQSLSARFGIITGIDLAQASRKYYPRYLNFILYLLAEFAIIACDIAEIVGMAIGLKLVFGLPLIWGLFITFLDTLLIFYLAGKNRKRMELIIISMITLISLSFIVELSLVHLPALPIIKGFIPSSLNPNALYIALGIIGATVMPHNLYLHSHLVAHQHRKGDKVTNRQSLNYTMMDTGIALNIAFFVNVAILLLSAIAFHSKGFTHVAELEDAHTLLKRLLGTTSSTLFGIALIASGQSSTITGTLAGQVIMEGYLNIKIALWLRRLITRSLALIPAVFLIYYSGEKALNSLLILSQVILGGQLCFAIIPLIQFNSFKNWMGELTLSKFWRIFGWISVFFILAINFYGLYSQLKPYLFRNLDGALPENVSPSSPANVANWLPWMVSWIFLLSVLLLLTYLILEPFSTWKKRKKQESWLMNETTI